MPDKTPIPYEEEFSARLTAKAARTCKVEVIRDEDGTPAMITVDGCPKCEHSTTFEYPLYLTKGLEPLPDRSRTKGLRLPPRAKHAETYHVTVHCQCAVKHPGAPGGKVGCGRRWPLDISVEGL